MAGTESKCTAAVPGGRLASAVTRLRGDAREAAALRQADGCVHEPLPPFGVGYSQSCSRAYRAASWRVRVWVFCIALDR
jgi:hypothetical protein